MIYHGDCYELLPDLPYTSAWLRAYGCMITDPPYELIASGGGLGKKRGYEKALAGLTHGFDIGILGTYENWMCFCAKTQLVKLMSAAQEDDRRWMLLTWNKPDPTPLINGNYLPDTEYIVHRFTKLYSGYHDRSRFTVMPGGDKLFHPVGKPLGLMCKLLRVATDTASLIVDPFMGSGTTLRAAKDVGRRAVGIEIEEKYCEIAARRMSQEVLEFT